VLQYNNVCLYDNYLGNTYWSSSTSGSTG